MRSSKVVAETKEKSGNALFIRLPRLVDAIQTQSLPVVSRCNHKTRGSHPLLH